MKSQVKKLVCLSAMGGCKYQILRFLKQRTDDSFMKDEKVLLIPMEENANLQMLRTRNGRNQETDYEVRLAYDKIDGWALYPYQGDIIAVTSDKPSMFLHAVNSCSLELDFLLRLIQPDQYRGIHLTFAYGLIDEVVDIRTDEGNNVIKLRCLFGGVGSSPVDICFNSYDCLHWDIMKTWVEEAGREKAKKGNYLQMRRFLLHSTLSIAAHLS